MTTRRAFLAGAIAAPMVLGALPRLGWTEEGPSQCEEGPSSIFLTSDFAVPPIDPDDYYDVACATALGFDGIVLDHPTEASVQALRDIGAVPRGPRALQDASVIVVIGAATIAATWGRPEARTVLFAGDASEGDPSLPVEWNVHLDPDAYAAVRARPGCQWVPCFDGGSWTQSARCSYATSTDEELGVVGRPWWDEHLAGVYGARNLWAGALLGFARSDVVAGAALIDGRFVAAPDYQTRMVAETRKLIERMG